MNCDMAQGTNENFNYIIGALKHNMENDKDYIWDGKQWVLLTGDGDNYEK